MIYLKSLQPLSFDRGPWLRYEAGSNALPCTPVGAGSNLDDGWHWTSPSNCCGGAAITLDTRPRLLEQAGGLYRRPRGRGE